jgi:hypothetical protein
MERMMHDDPIRNLLDRLARLIDGIAGLVVFCLIWAFILAGAYEMLVGF